jgi:hypothetical protein
MQDQIFVLRVLFELVMTQPSHAGDGAAESMLVVAHLGAAVDCQGAAINHPGAASDHQGAAADCRVSFSAVKVLPATGRGHQRPSRCCHR